MTEAQSSQGGAAQGLTGPPLSKTEYVLQRLREDIASGVVVPGTSLRQSEIAARYGVSATPVREALRLLEAGGSISYAPHRGATVRELSPERVRDVYLLRAEIEGLATAVACERMTDEQFARIEAVHEEIRAHRGGDGEELAVLNRRLHFTIYHAGSELIASHASSLWSLFPPRVTIWAVPDAAAALAADHDGIIEALRARDAKLAQNRARDHVLHAADLREHL
ncbi:GntR family transcriptional regulator [Geodermatophilus sp. DSM 45219]|uniref:GntR family transcriptional regulator n=1 Tax=Geodermatophilus sp. DSM 45219 TaxID=1881103 RepID=UPI00088BA698|nr:GntR family transcriptional regulator [Geodermatophilus sp. DSM 45219]SDN56468.1 transcriptional regulator, GntR family [Geodermatophilus sp. DSM 45219]